MDAIFVSRIFVRYEDGSCALMDAGGDLEWSSDNDDEFLEEFDATISSDEIEDVLGYLADNEYLEDGEEVDIQDEGEE
jgi:hypothetical protein